MDTFSNPSQSLALLAPLMRSWQRILGLPKRTRSALFAVGAGVLFSAGIFAAGASYAGLIGQIGASVSEVTTAEASQSASLTQLQSQQSALSSVDMNDQAGLLQTYEQSYQAAAKVFTILNSLITSAINLGVETAVSV